MTSISVPPSAAARSAAGLDLDRVAGLGRRGRAWRWAISVEMLGQVLVQGAAADDVERLGAAADRQDRHLAGVGAPRDRELEAVEVGLGRAQFGVRLGAVVRPGRGRGRRRGRCRRGGRAAARSRPRPAAASPPAAPPAASSAAQVGQARAPSPCRGGSPSGVGLTRSAGRTSEVVTPISGRSRARGEGAALHRPLPPAASSTQVSLQPPPLRAVDDHLAGAARVTGEPAGHRRRRRRGR